jgi:hypothetical protein
MSGDLSRRSVLATAASLTAVGSVCALIPGAAATVLAPVAASKLAYRRSAFLPLVGQRFQISGHRGATVVLTTISDLKPTIRPGAEEQFSLIFTRDPRLPAIPQGTYSITHARAGRISLLIVPIGRGRTVQQYQAVINTRPLAAIP